MYTTSVNPFYSFNDKHQIFKEFFGGGGGGGGGGMPGGGSFSFQFGSGGGPFGGKGQARQQRGQASQKVFNGNEENVHRVESLREFNEALSA